MKIVKLIDNPSVIEACGIAIIGMMILGFGKDINYDLRSTNYDSSYATSTE